MTQTKLPFGVIVQPFVDNVDGEFEMPVVETEAEGPLRCSACGAYINLGMTFTDNGSVLNCNLCGEATKIQVNQYKSPDSQEMSYGSYEFRVGGQYIYKSPRSPTFTFIIDVSHESLSSGLFEQVIELIQVTLDSMPNSQNTHISIITVDTQVHLYQVSNDINKEPSILTMCEQDYSFLPYPSENFMLNLVDDREKIDRLLESLVRIHVKENDKGKAPGLCLTGAMQVAMELMLESGGRMLTFYSRLDNFGPGAH